jgi:cytoskeletal protein CcmA (bactofilin family)
MFSSKTKDAAPPTPALTPVAPVNGAKRAIRGTAPSIISADLNVSGALISSGDIQVDGIVEGDVRSAGLVIGEKAEIRGEVLAEDVTVRGRVIGRIRARKVQLCATAHVEGDILHEAFSVEAGAFFEGNCRHSDNPLGNPLGNPSTSNTLAKPSNDEAKRPVLQTAPGQPGIGLTGLAGLAQPAE